MAENTVVVAENTAVAENPVEVLAPAKGVDVVSLAAIGGIVGIVVGITIWRERAKMKEREKIRKEKEEQERRDREEARRKELEDRQWNLERDRERWTRQIEENAKVREFELQMTDSYWDYRKVAAEQDAKIGIAKEFADSDVQVAREEAAATKYTADKVAAIENSKHLNKMKEASAKYAAVAKSVGEVMHGVHLSAEFSNKGGGTNAGQPVNTES